MKLFLALLSTALNLGILFGIIWYLTRRLRQLFELSQGRRLFWAVGAAFMTSVTGMLAVARAANPWIGLLGTMAGYFFTLMLYLTLALLVFDLIQFKWPLPKRWVRWPALGLALGFTLLGALLADPFQVSEIDISLPGLKQEVVVMHISDVHVGHHRGRGHLSRIVAETNKRRPDFVLLNGDLIDSVRAYIPGMLEPLRDFEAPVFFVNGNHDNYMDTERLVKTLEGHGVRVLRTQVVETHGLALVGLDYMNPDEEHFDMHPAPGKKTIKEVLPALDLPADKPSILMHHSPVGAKYAAAKGIDLFLAGHTHAGQMFPATVLAPLVFPFTKGLNFEGDMPVFVSQGAGTFGPRIRLGTSNEINLIRLKPGA